MSSSIEQLTGAQPGSLVARSFVELLEPADASRFEQIRTHSGQRGAPESFEVSLPLAGGGRRRCRLVVESVASSPVQPAVVVLVQDIEPALRLQREARLLRRVTEACNESSSTEVLFDRCVEDIRATMDWRAGRVLRVDGSGQLVPIPPVGPDISTAPDAGGWADEPGGAVVQAARSGRPVFADRGGTPAASPAGGLLRGQAVVPVVVDGRTTAVLEFVMRESVDEGCQGELQKLFTDIGQQLGSVVERQSALAALAVNTEELERSNAELERFAYVASHDLQEPLRKIVGFSELLVQRSGEALDDTGHEYLSYVVDGARRRSSVPSELLVRGRPAPRGHP